jgi:hypothetical protein
MRLFGRQKKKQRGEWKTFWLIALVTACPVVFTTVAIRLSQHPDVYWVSLTPSEGDAKFVGWRTVDDLASEPGVARTKRPDLFEEEVQVLGYMLQFPASPIQDGTVGRFLLVPDPGNWLQAPHLHSGEVIDVRLGRGRSVPLLEGRVVIVRGRMSVDPMKLDPGEIVFHLLATSVNPRDPPD